jgi:phthiodiolone/phenolphthiodiolone dimycocerosates ketoreductase
MAPSVYADNLEQLRSAAAKAGRSQPTASMYVWALVCDTHEAAHALLRAPFLRSLLLFRGPEFFQARGLEHPLAGVAASTDYLPTRLTREQALRALERVPESLVHDYVVHGTPADVRAWTAEMEGAGMQHVVLYDVAPYVQGGAAASRLGDLLRPGR